ncbi:hypothetical protein MSPP1_001298 [Malassezia sp. CBS 17886]|nr:hypothetical protein MSPP1_001298 [Malassezia sp. CBS 17886]
MASSRLGHIAAQAWTRRRPIAFAVLFAGTGVQYALVRRDAYLRNYVYPDTYLVWKVYDGSIVEARRAPSLGQLVAPTQPGDEHVHVMELYEVIRALKWAQGDERIRGIIADFSSLHVPASLAPQQLGLAQLEEIARTLQNEFRAAKREQFGDERPSSIAWTDSFDSQGAYLLATAFDRVYMQPSGQVPLVGLSSQIPFFHRLLRRVGVHMHAEARGEYKSMVSPFMEEDSLPPAQLANQAELIGELNRGYAHIVGVNRFRDREPGAAADRVVQLAREGPLSAAEAVGEGLIDGTCFWRDVVRAAGAPREEERGENTVHASGDMAEQQAPSYAPDATRFKTLYHYAQLSRRHLDRMLGDDEVVHLGVVYLLGTISNASGAFSVSAAIQGLREAAEDPSISGIVLRIDSGGGDVVASECLWDAVRRVRDETGKPVVASFGNAAASGGYYVATAADAILAGENTITGSIGVAALRPTVTRSLLEHLSIAVQSFFTGSTAASLLHELDPDQIRHMAEHTTHTYEAFLTKVCEGRGISADAVHGLAGGRVMTGLAAWLRCHPDVKLLAPCEGTVEIDGDAPEAEAPHAPSAVAVRVAGGDLLGTYTTRREGAPGNEAVRVVRAGGASAAEPRRAQSEDSAGMPAADGPGRDGAPAAAPAFGRGLVDAIGGLWDASLYTMTVTLQAEVDRYAREHNVSEETATQLFRPGCSRSVNDDGVTALSADVHLVKFPEEKPLWRRLQYSATEQSPSLRMDLVGTQLASTFAAAALRVWTSCVGSDPTALDALAHALRQGGTSGRVRAEYPFSTQFL